MEGLTQTAVLSDFDGDGDLDLLIVASAIDHVLLSQALSEAASNTCFMETADGATDDTPQRSRLCLFRNHGDTKHPLYRLARQDLRRIAALSNLDTGRPSMQAADIDMDDDIDLLLPMRVETIPLFSRLKC